MSDAELSAIFSHHAFDPWLPESRGRDCSVVMDKAAFLAAVAEFSKQDVKITHTGDDMSDQELDSMWHMSRPYFRAAVREAIAAKTRELVDALRPWSILSCLKSSKAGDIEVTSCVIPSSYIREAARLVAEYDAAQKGTTP